MGCLPQGSPCGGPRQMPQTCCVGGCSEFWTHGGIQMLCWPTSAPTPAPTTPPPTPAPPPEFGGDYKLRNNDSGKYLSVDCWWYCPARTNVIQYDDTWQWPKNRIFELQDQGGGVHLLKSKRGDLWVTSWDGSV